MHLKKNHCFVSFELTFLAVILKNDICHSEKYRNEYDRSKLFLFDVSTLQAKTSLAYFGCTDVTVLIIKRSIVENVTGLIRLAYSKNNWNDIMRSILTT